MSRVRRNSTSVSSIQGLKLVGRAQIEIGDGELDLRGELRIGEIGGARLRRGGVGLDRAADAAPDVELPAGVGGVGETVRIDRVAGGGGRASSRRRIIRRDGRKEAGLALPNDLPRLVICRRGGCDILIGEFDLGEQLRQLWIVEDAPPGTAIRLVERRDRLPSLFYLARFYLPPFFVSAFAFATSPPSLNLAGTTSAGRT